MRHRWLRSLALSLGIVVMGQGAFVGAETPAPIIQPYPPVETTPRPAPQVAESPGTAAATENAEVVPAATLDRPVALRDEPKDTDRQIQPTGLFVGRRNDAVVTSPDATVPVVQPLPIGSPNNNALPMPAPMLASPPPPDVPYSWRQPPASPFSVQGPASGTFAPLPSTSGKTGSSSSTATSPSIVSSPGLVPSPSIISSPGLVATPGVLNGPVASSLGADGCLGDGCCAPDGCGLGCGDGCCGWGDCCGGGCGHGCCFGDRWYGSAEYLLWFIRGQALPPLLTSGSVADPLPGALGQPGTNILYGGNNVNNNPYSGVRLRGGYWFNDNHGLGIDLGGFILGGTNTNFSTTSLGVPFLARPFVNALTGAQDIEAVATPNGLAGTFSALSTFFLYGAEANLRRNLLCGCNWFIDGFVGWRLLGLNEALTVRENLAVVSSANPALPAGSTFAVTDRFGTSNLFNGGQIGVIGEYRLGRWSVNVRDSVAVGGTMQFVNISGSTFSQGPGIPATTAAGGLLAQSSNMGGHTGGAVSFVEEIGVNVGYQFTNHLRGFVGYNFLYWTNVVRPGNQIDSTVNPNLIPPAVGGGPARPAFNFNNSDFWVQGITFGLDIRW